MHRSHLGMKANWCITHRQWLLLSSSNSSLKMSWRVKVAAHFPLTSSLHKVHTNCDHVIRAVNRHMSWGMRISAFFSWACTSLIFSANLSRTEVHFHVTTYQHYQKGTIKYKNWSINSTFFKSSLTSSLSDLSSLLDGVWARADASGRKATGCWRYVPFDPGTLRGQVEIWKEKKWTSISWRPVASPASFGKLVIANMKFDFNSCHEVKSN